MSVERHRDRWRVRWREGDRNRSRSFDRRRDAERYDAEVRRRRQLGALGSLESGTETLDEYVVDRWAPTYAAGLARRTQLHYASLYDLHISPFLGDLPLRQITSEEVARWQAGRLRARAGPVAVRHAFELLGAILQRAYEGGQIDANPTRRVKKAPRPRRVEVRPLAPSTVEAMRATAQESARFPHDGQRDATLLSVLAYAGLRPGEALGLRWGDVRDKTLLVERAISLGEETDTKTRQHRAVRLLGPLRVDLAEFRLASRRPGDRELIFRGPSGGPWTHAAWQSWRRRVFGRAANAAGAVGARPYDLRHSFASLLLHEGRQVIYVARQLGHDARLTLTCYGHVMAELEDAPRIDAEAAIRAARAGEPVSSWYPSAVGGAEG